MFTGSTLRGAALILGALSLPTAATSAPTPDADLATAAQPIAAQPMPAASSDIELARSLGTLAPAGGAIPSVVSWNRAMVRSCVRTGTRMVC